MTSTDLTGSTALVTGGTSGIGRAAAVLLAQRGAHVLIRGRAAARGDTAVAAIRADGGQADFIAADLASGKSVRELARQAIEVGGGHVDILVNSAGIFPFGPTPGATDADIDQVYAINVKAPFILVGKLAPTMAARGHGAIINVLTMVAHFGVAGMALYGSSKAALTLLTKAWAAEFGPSGVRVNAVSPGRPAPRARQRWAASLTCSPPWPPAGPPAGPAGLSGPGWPPRRSRGDRLRDQLSGRERGQLRARRRHRRRRRPPRRLTGVTADGGGWRRPGRGSRRRRGAGDRRSRRPGSAAGDRPGRRPRRRSRPRRRTGRR